MFLNYSFGSSGGGGNTTINITGSTNNIVTSESELASIISPKRADSAYVTDTKELYTYNNGSWEKIPTSDIFHNKLSSLSEIGHVQLTSDITSDSESLAITPKALKEAIAEIKVLIDEECCEEKNEWDDVEDGIDDNGSSHEWSEW